MKRVLLASLLLFVVQLGNAQCWQTLSLPIENNSVPYLLRENGDLYRIPQSNAPSSIELFDTTKTWSKIFSAAKVYGTFGIKQDGSLWAWGDNLEGVLGLGHKDTVLVPAKVNDGPWEYVNIDGTYAFGYKSDGSVWHWGMDSLLSPTLVSDSNMWKQIDASSGRLFMLGMDGDFYEFDPDVDQSPVKQTTGRGYLNFVSEFFGFWCQTADSTYEQVRVTSDYSISSNEPVFDFNDYQFYIDYFTSDPVGIHKEDGTLSVFNAFFGTTAPELVYSDINGNTVLGENWMISTSSFADTYVLDSSGYLWYGNLFGQGPYSVEQVVFDTASPGHCGNAVGYISVNNEDTCAGGYGAYNVAVTIEPGGFVRKTDYSGYINFTDLEDGTYTVTMDTIESGLLPNCELSKDIEIVDGVLVGENWTIYAHEKNPCTKPYVHVAASNSRSCANAVIGVWLQHDLDSYEYQEGLDVLVSIDTLYTVDSANVAFQDLGNNNFLIEDIDLTKGEPQLFKFYAFLDCDAQINRTLVNQAEVLKVDPCAISSTSPNGNENCSAVWDESELEIESVCINDTAYFSVRNVGVGDMECTSRIQLDVNGSHQWHDSIQLAAGDSILYAYLPQGSTFYMNVQQHPMFAGNSRPETFLEACGSEEYNYPFARAYSPTDDLESYKDISFMTVRNSYDPNQKVGYPIGLGEDNLIEQNQDIEYRIDFQNTGNDTAFVVVVRDTLPEELNLLTLTPLGSSHPYKFSIEGERVGVWTFDNINLLDSANHEEESKGYFEFTIEQNKDLPYGTDINNRVGIYFDFNPPIITNTAHHQIADFKEFIGIKEWKELSTETVAIYPNPNSGSFQLEVKGLVSDEPFQIVDLKGRVVLSGVIERNNQHINVNAMKAGIYFVRVGERLPVKMVKF